MCDWPKSDCDVSVTDRQTDRYDHHTFRFWPITFESPSHQGARPLARPGVPSLDTPDPKGGVVANHTPLTREGLEYRVPGGVVRYRALETHLFWKVVSFCSSSSKKYKHQFEELLLKVDCCVWGFGDGHWLSARLTTLSLFPRLLPKPCLFRSRFFAKCLSTACLKVLDF